MMRVLKAQASVFDIMIVPRITKHDVQRFCEMFHYEPINVSQIIEERGSRWVPRRRLGWVDKFSNGLGEAFLWALTACFGVSLEKAELVARKMAERELLSSTGLRWGFALPHAHSELFDLVKLCVMRFEDVAFEFETLDGTPAQIFAMFIIPQDRPGDGLRAKDTLGAMYRALGKEKDGELLASVMAQKFNITEPYAILDL